MKKLQTEIKSHKFFQVYEAYLISRAVIHKQAGKTHCSVEFLVNKKNSTGTSHFMNYR